MEAGANFKNKIKVQNRVDVLNILLKEGPASRVDLAKKMGLTKPALTMITNDMIEAGILLEKGEMPHEAEKYGRGRRKIILTLNEYYKLAFGAAVEKDSLQIGLTNLKGEIMDKQTIPLEDMSYRSILEKTAASAEEILKQNCLSQDRLLGMGITVSRNAEKYIEGQNTAEKLAKLRRDMQKAFNAKIYTARTIDGALAAEALFSGETGGVSDALVLRYGEDMSSGVMIGGRIYTGASCNAGGFNVRDENEHALYKGTVASKDERLEQKLLENLASKVTECIKYLDISDLYIFGSFFEDEGMINRLNLILEKIGNRGINPAKVSEKTLFLCGCAVTTAYGLYRLEE